MVHLSSIPARPLVAEPAQAGAGAKQKQQDGSRIRDLGTSEFADEFTTSVYGSRYAAQTLPKDEMPEGEMPRDVAYRMIKDDLSLDGNPRLKCVLFTHCVFMNVITNGC